MMKGGIDLDTMWSIYYIIVAISVVGGIVTFIILLIRGNRFFPDLSDKRRNIKFIKNFLIVLYYVVILGLKPMYDKSQEWHTTADNIIEYHNNGSKDISAALDKLKEFNAEE